MFGLKERKRRHEENRLSPLFFPPLSAIGQLVYLTRFLGARQAGRKLTLLK